MEKIKKGSFPLPQCCFGLSILMLVTTGCGTLPPRPAFQVPAAGASSGLYRGIYHVHTRYSKDSKTTVRDVIQDARKVGLDFVLVADRDSFQAREDYQKVQASSQDPVLLFGLETGMSQGSLVALGLKDLPPENLKNKNRIEWILKQGGSIFLSHPNPESLSWSSWKELRASGLEIYNFSDDYESSSAWLHGLSAMVRSPKSLLKAQLRTPYTELLLWDQKLKGEKVPAVASIDAPFEAGFLQRSRGPRILKYQAVTTYLFAEKRDPEMLTQGLMRGKTFFAFEVLGFARDFSMNLWEGNDSFGIGSEVPFKKGQEIRIHVPQSAEIRLIHNGQIVQRIRRSELVFLVQAQGAYRVEVYLKGKLWIFTNPLYVGPPAPKESESMTDDEDKKTLSENSKVAEPLEKSAAIQRPEKGAHA